MSRTLSGTRQFFLLLALITVALSGTASAATVFSSISSTFNGTSIRAGNYLWFHSHVKVARPGTGKGPAKVTVAGGTITFTHLGVPYALNVPTGVVQFTSAVSSASTLYNSGMNTWTTLVPLNYTGDVFIAGLPYLVPINFSGGIKPVVWGGNFSTDTPGVSLAWQWSAAVYTQFSLSPNALGVKPIEGSTLNPYANSDHCGTPENYKRYVIGGARGGGGSNYTGSWSGTASLSVPLDSGGGPSDCAAIGGSITCADDGHPIANATVQLLASPGGQVVQTVMTGTNGDFIFQTDLLLDGSPRVPDGTYSIHVTYSPDWNPADSLTFSYTCAGANQNLTVGMTPMPIAFDEILTLRGQISFSDVDAYRNAPLLGTIDTDANPSALYNQSLASGFYAFKGTVPGFGTHYDLGQIWVFVDQPLLREDRWQLSSLTNRIGLDTGIGQPSNRGRTPFNVQVLFNHPNLGPGTAHVYALTNMAVGVAAGPSGPAYSFSTTSFTSPPTLWKTDGSLATPTTGTDVPAGWMAQTRFGLQVPAQTSFAMTANGTYRDACGDSFTFSVHPDDYIP